jgi:serine/threonine protein kinase
VPVNSNTPNLAMPNLLSKLASLNASECKLLVAQMKIHGQQELLLSEREFTDILKYLQKYIINNVYALEATNGLVFTKNKTKLARSFVLSNTNNRGKLNILTNRKYYDDLSGKVRKYEEKNKRVVLGHGACKLSKVCISITLDEKGQLLVNNAVRLRNNLHKFMFEVDAHKVNKINNKLYLATTMQEIIDVLHEAELIFGKSVMGYYLSAVNEFKNSQLFDKVKNITPVEISNPMFKKIKGRLSLITYFFDYDVAFNSLRPEAPYWPPSDLNTFCPIAIDKRYSYLKDLQKKQIKSSYNKEQIPSLFKHWITQLLEAVSKLHEKGVLHCDIKAVNTLISEEPNEELYVRLTDFGASINVPLVLEDTKKLLSLLGYKNVGDGYVVGTLLKYQLVSELLIRLNKSPDLVKAFQKLSAPQEPLTLDMLTQRVKQIIPTFSSLKLEETLTTGSHACPEVYYFHRSLYSADLAEHLMLGGSIALMISKDHLSFKYQINPKYDVWATGVTVFEVLFGRYPMLNAYDLAIIIANPFLLGMLHPDFDSRFDIEQALKTWNEHKDQRIIIPYDKKHIAYLSSKYMELIDALKEKLRKESIVKDLDKKMQDISELCNNINCIINYDQNTIDLPWVRQSFKNLNEILNNVLTLEPNIINEDIFVHPGLPIHFLSEFAKDNSSKFIKLFENSNLHTLILYVKKYFAFLNKQTDADVMESLSHIYTLIVTNVALSGEQKISVINELLSCLINGLFEFDYRYQLSLARNFVNFIYESNININDALLHVALSDKNVSSRSDDIYKEYYSFIDYLMSLGCNVAAKNAAGFSALDIALCRKNIFKQPTAYDEFIKNIINKNLHYLSVKDLEVALHFAIINSKGQKIIEFLVATLRKQDKSWSNYNLSYQIPIWVRFLNTDDNESLAYYIQALNIPSQDIMTMIVENIDKQFIDTLIAIFTMDRNIFNALQTHSKFNILEYLAQNAELCKTINFYTGEIKNLATRYNQTYDLKSYLSNDEIIKLCLGEDLKTNCSAIAKKSNNLHFIVFLLKSHILQMPANKDLETQISQILSEFSYQGHDMSIVTCYLEKCTSTINPDISLSAFSFALKLLQDIKFDVSDYRQIIFLPIKSQRLMSALSSRQEVKNSYEPLDKLRI